MNLVAQHTQLPKMGRRALSSVKKLEEIILECPQTEIDTHHQIHGGCYSRTIKIPAGVVLTGALIKVPTTLIVVGHCHVYIGRKTIELDGYNVIPGSAGRKQAFIAITDTWMTMIFPTQAITVEEAEKEFTDEYDILMSNNNKNTIIITGE